MAIEQEVLVVGGGIAGTSAALSAADAGADVRLVSYKQSTLRSASGLVDVLGYTPDGEGPIVDPFEAIPDLPPEHPYRRAGLDAVEAGLELFDDVVDTYEGSHTERNALVPTHGGTVKPTARYPESAAAGLASDSKDVLLVGFERLVDFDAPLAAEHLSAAGAPFRARGVTLEFPIELNPDTKVTRYAHLLDRDEHIDGGTRGVRRALAEQVKGYLDGEGRVGFPAVLGDDHPGEVRAALADHIGADVFEVPMGPPSLPGLRLEDALFDALDSAGVKIETGNPVVDYEASDGRVGHVLVDRNGAHVPYAAAEFVLATGGLVGKGLDSDRERVEEPIFDCHVPQPADRYDWFEEAAFGDHEFARFGVPVDETMRPQDPEGVPEFENLRAAGSVLGGYDYAAEKSGSGVSLATGYRAGTLTGERV